MNGLLILGTLAGGLIIFWLFVKNAMIRAEMRGIQKALPTQYPRAHETRRTVGCANFLAVLAAITVLALMLALGVFFGP